MLSVEMESSMGAMSYAYSAPDAMVAVDFRLRRSMQLKFPWHAGASHAEILQCASESGLLMSLKVGHAYDDVGIGYGRSDFRGLAIFSVDGYFPWSVPLSPSAIITWHLAEIGL